jgi:hypothetical protein
MNLLRTLVAIQSLIILTCLVTLAIDIYFIHLYIQHDTIVFIWRFYLQLGLFVIWTVFFTVSLFTVVIRHRRRRYQPTSPPDPFATTDPAEDGFSLLKLMALLLRPLSCLASAVAMLFVTVQALIYSTRSVLLLSSSRGAPQTDYSDYDPRNLMQCEGYSPNYMLQDDSVYSLCPLDRATISLGIVAALFVVVEALLMFLYNNQESSVRSKVDYKRNVHSEGKVLHP